MNAYFRALAVHQAHFYKSLLANWGTTPGADQAGQLVEGTVHDGLWLTKFPLLHTPGYGVVRLDTLNKAWQVGSIDPEEAVALRSAVDADLVRFVLSLKPEDYERRVEIFYGGRAMNKPLWNYLIAWLERSAALRAGLAQSPGMLDTVFS